MFIILRNKSIMLMSLSFILKIILIFKLIKLVIRSFEIYFVRLVRIERIYIIIFEEKIFD
jgi:hypothetical protein